VRRLGHARLCIFLDKLRAKSSFSTLHDSAGWQAHNSNLGALLQRFPEVCKFTALEVR